MAKISDMQDAIRQAAAKLADELITKAIEIEGRETDPPSLGRVIIRMSAVDNADFTKVKTAVSVDVTVGDG
jgi:hypothetical protein